MLCGCVDHHAQPQDLMQTQRHTHNGQTHTRTHFEKHTRECAQAHAPAPVWYVTSLWSNYDADRHRGNFIDRMSNTLFIRTQYIYIYIYAHISMRARIRDIINSSRPQNCTHDNTRVCGVMCCVCGFWRINIYTSVRSPQHNNTGHAPAAVLRSIINYTKFCFAREQRVCVSAIPAVPWPGTGSCSRFQLCATKTRHMCHTRWLRWCFSGGGGADASLLGLVGLLVANVQGQQRTGSNSKREVSRKHVVNNMWTVWGLTRVRPI